MHSSRQKDLSKVAPEPTGVDVPVGPGLRCWGPGHMGTLLAPGPVAFVPLVSGLVGGGQVQTEAQVAPQEEAQHHDEAHQEDDPREGQEQVLGAKEKQRVRQPGGDGSQGHPTSQGLVHTHGRAASPAPPSLTH